jgi:hypothetical protein
MMRKLIGLLPVCFALVLSGCGSDAPELPKGNVSKHEFQTANGLFFFQSPDHGIKCGIFTRGFPEGVGCQTYLTPIPADILDCDPLGGNHSIGIQITDGEAKSYCLAQGIWIGPTAEGLNEAGGLVLKDGEVIEVEGAVCESKANAITCTKDGAGFMMSATENKVF